jgi:hypothetical protein
VSVQDRIAELEREVARKKALVNAKITLPKDTPEAVKTEVMAEITEALLKLAANEQIESQSAFTEEEVKVLKLLANRAQGKSATTTSPSDAVKADAPAKEEKVLGKIEKNPVPTAGSYKGLEAEIVDLSGVPVSQRGKVASMDRCLVMDERDDGLVHVITRSGVRFNIDPQFLNFDIESN